MNTSHNSLLHKTKIPIAIAAVTAVAMMVGGSASAYGLDNTDLQVVNSSQEGSEFNRSALRVVTADEFENIGIGLANAARDNDGDSMASAVQLEATDYAENLNGFINTQSIDNDGDRSSAGGSLSSQDYLENLSGSGQLSSTDDNGDSSMYSLSGSSQDYGESANVQATSNTVDDDETNNTTIRFGFED